MHDGDAGNLRSGRLSDEGGQAADYGGVGRRGGGAGGVPVFGREVRLDIARGRGVVAPASLFCFSLPVPMRCRTASHLLLIWSYGM